MIIYASISIIISLFISVFGFIGINHYLDSLDPNTEEITKDSFWLKTILIISLLAILACQGLIIYDVINESRVDVLEEEK